MSLLFLAAINDQEGTGAGVRRKSTDSSMRSKSTKNCRKDKLGKGGSTKEKWKEEQAAYLQAVFLQAPL